MKCSNTHINKNEGERRNSGSNLTEFIMHSIGKKITKKFNNKLHDLNEQKIFQLIYTNWSQYVHLKVRKKWIKYKIYVQKYIRWKCLKTFF